MKKQKIKFQEYCEDCRGKIYWKDVPTHYGLGGYKFVGTCKCKYNDDMHVVHHFPSKAMLQHYFQQILLLSSRYSNTKLNLSEAFLKEYEILNE